MSALIVDWAANQGRFRVQVCLLLFRLAQLHPRGLAGKLLKVAYKMTSTIVLAIDLPTTVICGPGLQVHHGFGLVVNGSATLGRGVVLRHGTTIGEGRPGSAVPSIGDFVNVGANATIIGGVVIGDHAQIGAGAVVVSDVAPATTVAGNPARPIARRPTEVEGRAAGPKTARSH